MNHKQPSDPPVILTLQPENIPNILQNLAQWILWKQGKAKPNGRYDKQPLNPRGQVANAQDPKNQMAFNEALALYNSGIGSGIGFVLKNQPIEIDSIKYYLVGIDIDQCVSQVGGKPLISDEVNQLWHKLGCPYLEFSPSGTGLRMFVLSTKPIKSSNKNGKEMYIGGRFLTVTGNGHGDIIDATNTLLALHAEWFPDKQLKKTSNVVRVDFAKSNQANFSNEEELRSALVFVSADKEYDDWRNIIWSIKSSGLDKGIEIARVWSETAPHRYSEEGFDGVWESFDSSRGITIGTLFYHAKLNGWKSTQMPDIELEEGDILNGKLLADANRDKLIFIHETGDILIFSESGWVNAPPNSAEIAAKEIVLKLRIAASEAFKADPLSTETKRKLAHASKSSLEPRVRAMISMAKSELGMTKRLSELDNNPQLLGVLNGVLDLNTRQLLEISPKLLISMRTSVEYTVGAKCPTWISFLSTIQPDKAVQRLLQQLVGIFLSGETQIQKLIIFYGLGANGKSTFIEVIAWLLGDYGLRIATEMLMHHQRTPQGPSPDIVSLKAKRMVFCNEVEEGRRVDEARVKEFTGGDTLTGRTPYAKCNITFRPAFNLVVIGNHKPEIQDMSHGMWRRILLILFGVTIPASQQDNHLVEKLKAEGSGILNWALAGYHDYLKKGLLIPLSITSATDGYKAEEDLLGEWLDEHAMLAAGAKAPISETYKAYQSWAEARGHRPFAQSRLTRRLKDRGFERDGGKRHYMGFELSIMGLTAARLHY